MLNGDVKFFISSPHKQPFLAAFYAFKDEIDPVIVL